MPKVLVQKHNKNASFEMTAWKKNFRKYWQLYLLLLPVVVSFVIFNYVPMAGIQIAFKDFTLNDGVWGSKWVGFEHFIRFFTSFKFKTIILNTFILSVENLVFSFPLPIILALVLNEIRLKRFKTTVQTILFAPHFISTVVVVGMMAAFLAPSTGIINNLLIKLGVIDQGIYFFRLEEYFRPLYISSTIWTNMGWNAIIYISAISSIDAGLYESAEIDGASRFKQMLNITLPCIMNIIITTLILNCGHILGIGYEKALLLQTSTNINISEVISTYVYDRGISAGQYDYATAIGLFNSVINFIMLIFVNKIAKKNSEVSLW